ncbi:MAG TPA: VOC family protein [Actinocrinis sp.]|uniref:VOC family protein n=1 Tax=Actinocrinis sp. TaxID=1920516 RepID=UPI002D667DCC|nr:VOC family protein [Actinocrinis sp.]HZU58566.1 VOC family protein [Actinocrinis sp.]
MNDQTGPASGAGANCAPTIGVTELRLVVTAEDYEAALAFYRDALGLPQRAAFSSPGGRVTILEAGRATLEIADPPHARYIDEVEVGHRAAGHIRVAFQVADAESATHAAAEAGASVVARPVLTPWNSRNARLDGPAGLQLTLFEELDG